METVIKAMKIFSRRFEIRCKSEQHIVIFMDLYQLPGGYPDTFPEGYKFSWIAFDPEDETKRVLFDCHPPKGPHAHIDEDGDGEPFSWVSLEAAYEFFFDKVRERFGEFEMEED